MSHGLDGLIARLQRQADQCAGLTTWGEAATAIKKLSAENQELADFVIACGGFWGNSRSELTGPQSLLANIKSAYALAEKFEQMDTSLVLSELDLHNSKQRILSIIRSGTSLSEEMAYGLLNSIFGALSAEKESPDTTTAANHLASVKEYLRLIKLNANDPQLVLDLSAKADAAMAAIDGIVLAERQACADLCQGVMDSGDFGDRLQYAATACRDAIVCRKL